jgi:hypothetical protein
VAAAVAALLTAPRLSARAAPTDLPAKAGVYAIFAELDTREALRLPATEAELPIYVGKAEKSLLARDGQTHFTLGRTSSSTLRRSIAALLHDSLELRGQPRNLRKPGYFDKFGLASHDEEALQEWIGRHLTIAVWLKPPDAIDENGGFLRQIECALLKLWTPPLNDSDNPMRWRELRRMRRVMADEARGWRSSA